MIRCTHSFVILRPALLAGRGTLRFAGGADADAECVGPSGRKNRIPQDDKA